MKPSVSILLPLYNGERFVEGAIRSVLDQEFSDWELLVQDDGSTDHGPAIVEALADPRVRLERNMSNLHIARTINAALARAEGSYIKLLAQDDRMLPGCLARQVQALAAHPEANLSIALPLFIDKEDHRMDWINERIAPFYRSIVGVHAADSFLALLLRFGCFMATISSALIRAEALRNHGGFDARFFICLDWDAWIRLSSSSSVVIGEVGDLEFREHGARETMNPDRILVNQRETYLCIQETLRALPDRTARQLRLEVPRIYGAVAIHSAMKEWMTGKKEVARGRLGVLRENGGLGLPVFYWALSLPGRLGRRVIGRSRDLGSIENWRRNQTR